MTREEAHRLAFKVAKNLEGKEVDQIILVLEALGLIEFDKVRNRAEGNKMNVWQFLLLTVLLGLLAFMSYVVYLELQGVGFR